MELQELLKKLLQAAAEALEENQNSANAQPAQQQPLHEEEVEGLEGKASSG